MHFGQIPLHKEARAASAAIWTQVLTSKTVQILVNPAFPLHLLDSINCGWGQPAAQTRRCPLLGQRAAHGALLAGPPADPATKHTQSSLPPVYATHSSIWTSFLWCARDHLPAITVEMVSLSSTTESTFSLYHHLRAYLHKPLPGPFTPHLEGCIST